MVSGETLCDKMIDSNPFHLLMLLALLIAEGQTPYEQLDMNASMSTLLLDKFSGRIKNQLNFIRELIDTHNATIQQEA